MAKRPHGKPRVARTHSDAQAPPISVSPGDAENFLVVGIGASAGGLDACRRFLTALPSGHGMAFILIQHLDPNHESMMASLLASHTSMTVRQATEGMRIERDNLYLIPPGTYLSVGSGVLHLSQPLARHGMRMPFDFLLNSLADAYGTRAACVVLSGTGADGSRGLKSIKEQHGLVVAQSPDEAGHDGMPRSAIMTGAVDFVRSVDDIPGTLIEYATRTARLREQAESPENGDAQDRLPAIIDLLRTKTDYNFTHYKHGTLKRRIERRMAMATIEIKNLDQYLEILQADDTELELLAKDILINVTGFFRDPKVFDALEEKIIPELVRTHPHDEPIRVWIPGCSTGEEAYSIAMLFREHIAAAKRSIKLQIFASDIDEDAVVVAREGIYPETISADVTPKRLARFFAKIDSHYQVSPALRSSVVFTVHDMIADPPFSRLDLISCRNLLIYLLPEAQAKVISLFHFALREGGILLLGNAETIGNVDDRFETISKSARLYRHIGSRRQGDLRFPTTYGDGLRPLKRREPIKTVSRQVVLADLCRRMVMATYSPAAILVNRNYECLFFQGPTDIYLRVPHGSPRNDLLAMARDSVRTKLRAALQRAVQEKAHVVVSGGRMTRNGTLHSFSIAAEPVLHEGEELLLVCFIDEPNPPPEKQAHASSDEGSRVADLEQELAATRSELHAAIHNLEISSEEQTAINEEALSVNEEFQSTNEELMTSKEELQSLNEELTALNSQLQETLERQRTTSNDLQNILYSTDVATLFLDIDLNIRFFTPATKLLFNVIPRDIGRPLEHLSSLATDDTLLADARTVLKTHEPTERTIEAKTGAWYIRRVLPYRTQESGVEGVVITFIDDTERRRTATALETAEREAHAANRMKSRFLAAASHDLRQPLQTLILLQGLLAKHLKDGKAKQLATRIDNTLGAMTGMLNTLLDIEQIEAGTVRADIVSFPIQDLLDRLRDEFAYHAQAKALAFSVVPCRLDIRSDPRFLEQMIRNLLSNALKYASSGKVLLGCRRRARTLSIEVWDTGIGIPAEEYAAIFEEYHQLDNPARERSRGLGLGLSIVRRLGNLLGHRIDIRSRVGKGSAFAIEVPIVVPGGKLALPERDEIPVDAAIVARERRTGAILIVEDDPEVCGALAHFLEKEGHRIAKATSGVAALEMMARGKFRPDLIIADYNLPNDMNGLQAVAKLREAQHRSIPSLILTGDASTEILHHAALEGCVGIKKPVKLPELTKIIRRLLPDPSSAAVRPASGTAMTPGDGKSPVVFVVDDDANVRAAIRSVLEDKGHAVLDFPNCESFLEAYRPGSEACLLIDAYLPGMSGLELLQLLKDKDYRLPAIMITGNSDVPIAVKAMKAGASDFIEKPIDSGELTAAVERALEQSRDSETLSAWRETAADSIAGLTSRQRKIMELVLAGHPSKNIAADLGISQRTVENHRAAIMKKTGSKSLPALARLALTAGWNGPDDPHG